MSSTAEARRRDPRFSGSQWSIRPRSRSTVLVNPPRPPAARNRGWAPPVRNSADEKRHRAMRAIPGTKIPDADAGRLRGSPRSLACQVKVRLLSPARTTSRFDRFFSPRRTWLSCAGSISEFHGDSGSESGHRVRESKPRVRSNHGQTMAGNRGMARSSSAVSCPAGCHDGGLRRDRDGDESGLEGTSRWTSTAISRKPLGPVGQLTTLRQTEASKSRDPARGRARPPCNSLLRRPFTPLAAVDGGYGGRSACRGTGIEGPRPAGAGLDNSRSAPRSANAIRQVRADSSASGFDRRRGDYLWLQAS